MRTADLHYDLPPDRIATQPAQPRDAARLMHLAKNGAPPTHHQIRDLPDLGLLRANDLLIFNQTRVAPALIQGRRRTTSGRVSGLFLEALPAIAETNPPRWRVMLESRGTLVTGEWVDLDDHTSLQLTASLGRGAWEARLQADAPTHIVLERLGRTPLPPYIRRERRKRQEEEVAASDQQRYNTVFAEAPSEHTGLSVAAPTAGLHFTPELLNRMDAIGVRRATVTLQVGLGTFEPVRTATLDEHPMHTEQFHVPVDTLEAMARTRAAGGRIVPVGTTSVRSLESLPMDWTRWLGEPEGYRGRTELLIQPGPDGEAWPFRFTDGLLTNFHLPESTLLALVAALPGMGLPRLLATYQQAIAREYHFFSYGDAMLIL